MKAFALDEFGAPGSIREVPDPEPGEGHVRIRVATAGLNPFDIAVINGYVKDAMEHRFPLIPGSDASGTVDAVGPGVTVYAVGDDVFGSMGKPYLGEGALAELAVMSTATIARKLASLEHADAASIPVAGVTAKNMVDAAAVKVGDIAVVIGATGGVGSFFVQLAKLRGAQVVAINRGENADYARSLGATDVIDYTAGDVVEAVRSRCPDGIDVVADLHRDPALVARLGELLRTGGHVVSATGGVDVDALAKRGVEGVNIQGRVNTGSLDELALLLEKKEIASPETESFSLDRANEAFALVGSGHARGKVVVRP
ncbi:MAG TPA: NADP-dependent oxidoreductase [Actinomycetota bacterium]|nr:NADP-dependent oxidoreductase [Actinomycetota bacterium]